MIRKQFLDKSDSDESETPLFRGRMWRSSRPADLVQPQPETCSYVMVSLSKSPIP